MNGVPQAQGNPATVAEQAARCFDLKKQGKSLREIGAELGISHETAGRRIREYVNALISPRVEDYRALQDAQLDDLERQLRTVLDDQYADPELKMKAVDRMVKLMDRRAKLHGVDAPVKVEGTVTHQSKQEAELEALFGELDARNEAVAAAIQAGEL